MKISVVYCTARKGGFDILDDFMLSQTFRDFEVIVMDELKRFPTVQGEAKYKYLPVPPKKEGMFWNLSASLNEACRHARGDIIVLLQDYIWVPPDGLQRYIDFYEAEGMNNIIAGVGHQYELPKTIDNPEGDWSVWNTFPGPPSGELTFRDPRTIKRAGRFLTAPVEWEANWSAFPRQAWLDIGGFDEDFDAGWGYDNVNFAERCQLAGYHVWLDCANEVKCYSHINLFNEQERRDKSPNNQKMWYQKYRDLDRHETPFKLNYCG